MVVDVWRSQLRCLRWITWLHIWLLCVQQGLLESTTGGPVRPMHLGRQRPDVVGYCGNGSHRSQIP